MSTLPLFDGAGGPRNGGGADDRVYRVGALNRAVRLLLEDHRVAENLGQTHVGPCRPRSHRAEHQGQGKPSLHHGSNSLVWKWT
jgi:hypothetical protein